jgi:hypothetical protein
VLFYNHKQEFLGIDEEGLKLLNYSTFDDLLEVCSDVADLFAKEPGYIHNFKSFGWIDFLLHADSDARSAIVHGNGRTFSCTLDVEPFFLRADPKNPGYVITMQHVQSMSGDEFKAHTITPKVRTETPPVYEAPVYEAPVFEKPDVEREPPAYTPSISEPFPASPSVLPNYDHITPTPLSEPGILDIPSSFDPESVEETRDDLYDGLSIPTPPSEPEKEYFIPEPVFEPESIAIPAAEPKAPRPAANVGRYTPEEQAFLDTLTVDKSYRFDPNVAAHELGLPVDLIEEFIGDFIQQSREFKDELFEATLKGDMNNLKILSHKLKGVAANLRIEDAFETLSVINTSNDLVEVEANLKYFYTIVDKLDGKEASEPESIDDAPIPEALDLSESTAAFSPSIDLSAPSAEDEIYEFAFKSHDVPAPSAAYDETLETSSHPTIELSDDEPLFKDEFSADLTEPSLQESTLPAYEEPDIIEPEPLPSLHYDKHFIAGQLGIEEAFFDELIGEYKRDAHRAGEEISEAIGAFDTHAWQHIASQLKGISDNLRLSEISDQLAILSRTNDAQEAHKASKQLNGYLEQL